MRASFVDGSSVLFSVTGSDEPPLVALTFSAPAGTGTLNPL